MLQKPVVTWMPLSNRGDTQSCLFSLQDFSPSVPFLAASIKYFRPLPALDGQQSRKLILLFHYPTAEDALLASDQSRSPPARCIMLRQESSPCPSRPSPQPYTVGHNLVYGTNATGGVTIFLILLGMPSWPSGPSFSCVSVWGGDHNLRVWQG